VRLDGGDRVLLPEIVDYEVRRETLRARDLRALALLDGLGRQIEYLPLTTETMRLAAEFWAEVRQRRVPTAPETGLDVDVILAAQAAAAARGGEETVVATENPRHLERLVAARDWRDVG
jgi:hypothetical protein